MVTNWHEVSEPPKYDKLCVIRIANNSNKIDYQIARFRGVWRYKTDRKVTYQVIGWAYINEPFNG